LHGHGSRTMVTKMMKTMVFVLPNQFSLIAQYVSN
jgi:hypothetical protein